MKLEHRIRVGPHQVEVWRTYTDVTAHEDAEPQRVAGLARIFIDGRQGFADEIERLRNSDLPGAEEFREVLQGLTNR